MTARVHLGASPNILDEVELAVVLGKIQDTVVERNYRFTYGMTRLRLNYQNAIFRVLWEGCSI